MEGLSMTLPEILHTVDQVETRYKKIEDENPEWTDTKVIQALQEVVRDDVFIAWWNQVYIKRWQKDRKAGEDT